jgi:hypothetical protein
MAVLQGGPAAGLFFTSCGARESAVPARGLAAVSGERAVEGVLGGVADLAGDRPDRVGGVPQPLRGEVHAPAREVGQRRLAHDLREAACERRAGDVDQASFDTGTVTVHIRRLREKIEADPSQPSHLETVWGVGYRFEP